MSYEALFQERMKDPVFAAAAKLHMAEVEEVDHLVQSSKPLRRVLESLLGEVQELKAKVQKYEEAAEQRAKCTGRVVHDEYTYCPACDATKVTVAQTKLAI